VYLPEYFKEKDYEELVKVVTHFPLAVLVCDSDGEIVVNHIPLIFENSNELIGHVAKLNPLQRQLKNGASVMAVFRAEDAYISPNYYPTKLKTHRHVPKWNYQAVHMYGKIIFTHSKKIRLQSLVR